MRSRELLVVGLLAVAAISGDRCPQSNIIPRTQHGTRGKLTEVIAPRESPKKIEKTVDRQSLIAFAQQAADQCMERARVSVGEHGGSLTEYGGKNPQAYNNGRGLCRLAVRLLDLARALEDAECPATFLRRADSLLGTIRPAAIAHAQTEEPVSIIEKLLGEIQFPATAFSYELPEAGGGSSKAK